MADGTMRAERQRENLTGSKRVLAHVWIVVGAIIIGAALLSVLGVLAPVIEFLTVGSLVAFVETPIVNFLERRGVPRGVGALAGLVVVVAAVVLVFAIILPVFAGQLMEILDRLPAQLRQVQEWFNSVSAEIGAVSDSALRDQVNSLLSALSSVAADYAAELAGNVGQGILPFIMGFASTLFVVFLGLVLAYWLARDYPRIHREIGTILGEDRDEDYRFMIAVLSRSVGGYMRGIVTTSVIGGLLAFAGFLLVGHPYASLMGVVTGVLHLVPVVGPWVSAAFAVIIAFFYSPALAFWTLVVTVVAQNVTDNVVSPKVMQSAVQVHPVMSLTALVVGSALLGPLGMVIAIPLTAAAKGLFVFYFESKARRQLVSYEGAIFRGTPYLDADGNPVPAFDALGDDSFAADSELVSAESVPQAEVAPKPHLPKRSSVPPWLQVQAAGRRAERALGKHAAAKDDTAQASCAEDGQGAAGGAGADGKRGAPGSAAAGAERGEGPAGKDM